MSDLCLKLNNILISVIYRPYLMMKDRDSAPLNDDNSNNMMHFPSKTIYLPPLSAVTKLHTETLHKHPTDCQCIDCQAWKEHMQYSCMFDEVVQV